MKSGDCMSIYKKLLSRTPSTSSVYFWNIAGSTTNALASMILLILVNRILGVEDGDIFSLAFSIGQVILTVATFQVRVYQRMSWKNLNFIIIFSYVYYLVPPLSWSLLFIAW